MIGVNRTHLTGQPSRRRGVRIVCGLLWALEASGCSSPIAGTSDAGLPRYSHVLSISKNVIESSMAGCEKTESAEAGCLNGGIAASGMSVAALVALIPGCRADSVCRYEYETKDMLGFVSVNSEVLRIRWRAEFDFEHSKQNGGAPSITVKQI